MKKAIYTILILATACVSCSTDEPAATSIDNNTFFEHQLSKIRSVDEALEIASRATSMLAYGGTASLAESRGLGRAVDYAKPVYTVRNQMSRSTRQDTLMYVINYTDDNGFAMISASRKFPEILAVTESGHFNPEEGTDNPGLSIWYDNMISTLASNDVWILDTLGIYNRIPLPGNRSKTEVDTSWVKKVPYQIKVNWGQSTGTLEDACEGNECPNGVAGCANTATGMIMTYLERPSSIELSYKAGLPTIDLNWKEIKRYCSVYDKPLSINPVSDYPIRERISQLLRELGRRAKSDYSNPTLTRTSNSDMLACLNALGLASDKTWLDGDCSYSILSNSAISLVGGSTKTGKGHVWVCDGILSYRIRSRYYDSTDGGLTWKLVDTHTSNQYTYMHHNWGWHGNANGYFAYGNYNSTGSDDHNYLSNHYSLKISK